MGIESIGAPATKSEAAWHWSGVNQQDSVQSLPTEQIVARWFETRMGGDVDAVGPGLQTQRLIATLQQALTLLNPASGTAH